MLSHRTVAVLGVVIASLALTGCGDDLFSNMNGTREANSAPASAAEPHEPAGDTSPHYEDNGAARRPGVMTREDKQVATVKAEAVKAALKAQRQRGQTSPDQLLSVLESIAAPGRVEVADRTTGTSGTAPADGSVFGLYIGESACVSGAVSNSRIWVDVNGHYPETGCIAPPAAH
ncbi:MULTISPECIES: hypothetical protein [Streptomyces]|uniref:Lipoprotein n=1 Tax=Streptomyces lienomycini TaxID=284035 RepID=A0ABV9X1G5_9ACTN|nr:MULTISPECIES: hypothetical protein [Streptomyces]